MPPSSSPTPSPETIASSTPLALGSVRPATLSDAEIIVEYNLRLARETEAKELDPKVLARGVARALTDPQGQRGRYYVVESNGSVVGQLLITFEWSDWRDGWIWWIQSVYVEAKYRKAGVFRVLFEHVLQEATREAVVALRLYVEGENHVAQQVYAHLGLSKTSYLVMERSLTLADS